MYKLIIVDDEQEIRQGLSDFIDWSGLGYELVDTFEDGKEAIEYMRLSEVNVVLTDVRMADISGLELAEYVYKEKLPIAVLIMSGYKEFSYAKQAIEYNVEHYLLKPTDLDEVTSVFLALKKKLDEKKKYKAEQNKIMNQYEEMIPLLQEQFFTDLTMGGFKNEFQIRKRLKAIDLPISWIGEKCALIKLNFDEQPEGKSQWIHGRERLHFAIKNFLRVTDAGISYNSFYSYNQVKVVAVSGESIERDEFIYEIDHFFREIIITMRTCLGMAFSYNIVSHFDSLVEMSQNKEHIKFFNVDLDEANYRFQTNVYQQLIEKHKLFVSVINEGDFDVLMNMSDNYIDEISELPIGFIHRLICDLFAILFSKLMEAGLDISEEIFRMTEHRNIESHSSIESIKGMVMDVFADVLQESANVRNRVSETAVFKAKQYIENNYNKDISLEDVSNEVFLNSVYFSRLFKQETGENFIDYLTKLRMERAIELLQMREYRVYEISDMIGYASSKYFSRVFKLYTGYSPKDYLKLVRR